MHGGGAIIFPFDDLQAAIARNQNREQLGKIVIGRTA